MKLFLILTLLSVSFAKSSYLGFHYLNRELPQDDSISIGDGAIERRRGVQGKSSKKSSKSTKAPRSAPSWTPSSSPSVVPSSQSHDPSSQPTFSSSSSLSPSTNPAVTCSTGNATYGTDLCNGNCCDGTNACETREGMSWIFNRRRRLYVLLPKP